MAMRLGTYDVKAKGHSSSYMPMQVKLSEDKIENISVGAAQAAKLRALRMKYSIACQN